METYGDEIKVSSAGRKGYLYFAEISVKLLAFLVILMWLGVVSLCLTCFCMHPKKEKAKKTFILCKLKKRKQTKNTNMKISQCMCNSSLIRRQCIMHDVGIMTVASFLDFNSLSSHLNNSGFLTQRSLWKTLIWHLKPMFISHKVTVLVTHF